MLAVASPLTSNFHHGASKDSPNTPTLTRGLDELLNSKVEFVEGSSTGSLSQTQGEPKYPYINVPSTEEESQPSKTVTSSPSTTKGQPSSRPSPTSRVLYDKPLVAQWAMPAPTSLGFINTGNTCFLNSVLQCLLHTTPLQHLLKQHGTPADRCHISGSFCMSCKMRTVMESSLSQQRNKCFIPSGIVNNLQNIAKHLRRNRQEDAHEFLRYSVDALQKSCIAGMGPKLDPKIAETSWVHRIFGGRLRSRVTCGSCGHASDTFDASLDLSLDVMNVGSVKQALSKFVQIDHLRGANKYKCDGCKKLVNAEKQFTVHDAPMCLTVHLKRFTPLGRKLGHLVDYGHSLDLQPAMSEGQYGPRYTLYGVISHAGSGPNSGHYYAHVKGRDGTWYEANDELVTSTSASSVTGLKSAYMLFYIRAPSDALGAAISLTSGNGNKKNMKRKSPDENDDRGISVSASNFRPTKKLCSSPLSSLPSPDPMTSKLNEKVANFKAAAAAKGAEPMKPLVTYESSDNEDETAPKDAVAKSTGDDPPSSSSVRPSGPQGAMNKRKSLTAAENDDSDSSKKRRKEDRESLRGGLGAPFIVSNNLHEVRNGNGSSAPPFKPIQHGNRIQQIAGVGLGGFPKRKVGAMRRKGGI